MAPGCLLLGAGGHSVSMRWRIPRFGAQLAISHANHFEAFRKPMMKIQINEAGEDLILQVEGRLAGVFVPELEHCWQTARANRPDRKISVDLKNLTCVDRAGRYLLQFMHRSGVPFLRAGLATRDIFEEITEQAECKH
jgi:hypothetical protein